MTDLNENHAKEELPEELLIESLWILDEESGICVFEENYVDFTKEGVSTDLISSFLSAVLTFAGETFTEEIEHIKFPNRKILFEFSDTWLFVISVSEQTSDMAVRRVMTQIVKAFADQFGGHFKPTPWQGGDVSVFNPFSQTLQEIVKKKPLKVKILQALDPKAHLKKIEGFVQKKLDFLSEEREKLRDKLRHKLRDLKNG